MHLDKDRVSDQIDIAPRHVTESDLLNYHGPISPDDHMAATLQLNLSSKMHKNISGLLLALMIKWVQFVRSLSNQD